MRLVTLTILALASLAQSAAAACTNDPDCPGSSCGGQVCQWGAAGHNCVAAGTDAQGSDGWCSSNTDCKCMAQGATCTASHHCTATIPSTVSPDLAMSAASHDMAMTTTTPTSGGCALAAGAAPSSAPWIAALFFALVLISARRPRRG